MEIINNFLRWELGIFVVLLTIFLILHVKYNFLSRFFSQTSKERRHFRNRTHFSLLIVLISFVSVFIYNFLGIFFRNFTGDLRMVILINALILVFIGTIIWAYLSSLNLYYRELSAFVIMTLIVFLINKDPNNLLGRTMIILFGFSLILIPFYFKIKWEVKKIYFWITILMMLGVFFIGIITIDGLYGEKGNNNFIELNLNINSDASNKYYEDGKMVLVKCFNPYEKIHVGTNLNCSISSDSIINDAKVMFISLQGNLEKRNLENMTFQIPYEISRIGFAFNLTSKDNETFYVTTLQNYKNIILTLENDKKREENFYLYFLALIGIIFLSIPSMMKTFKEL